MYIDEKSLENYVIKEHNERINNMIKMIMVDEDFYVPESWCTVTNPRTSGGKRYVDDVDMMCVNGEGCKDGDCNNCELQALFNDYARLTGQLERQLTIEQMREMMATNGRVEGVVDISIDELVHCGEIESLFNLLSKELTGSTGLSDIHFELIGATASNHIKIKVSGNGKDILDCI